MAYQQLTRAQLRARLQDYWEGTVFWTEDEANRAINEALRTWNFLTGRWRDRETLITTPNNHDYAISTTILYRTRVMYNGQPMDSTSYTSLAAARPRWLSETTTSGGDVPTRPTLWCPISLRTILIWPADALAWNSLTVDGVARTPQLILDGQYVNLAEADVSVLLPYALHVASFKKGGQAFANTGPMFAKFLAAAGEENRLITTSQYYRRFMGLYGRDQKPLAELAVPAGLQTPGSQP